MKSLLADSEFGQFIGFYKDIFNVHKLETPHLTDTLTHYGFIVSGV